MPEYDMPHTGNAVGIDWGVRRLQLQTVDAQGESQKVNLDMPFGAPTSASMRSRWLKLSGAQGRHRKGKRLSEQSRGYSERYVNTAN